jgi:hypothetical protein
MFKLSDDDHDDFTRRYTIDDEFTEFKGEITNYIGDLDSEFWDALDDYLPSNENDKSSD